MCTRLTGDCEEIVTIAESRRTAQAASAAVRRQKRELAVCVPITALFSDIPSNGLSVPINARIVPDTALSDEQAKAWQRLWGMLLSGESD